jgi:hypothetical protein
MARGVTQRLKRAWEVWKVLAHKIGTFQARVLLTILYVLFVLPFGTWMRLFADPLRIKKPPQQWLERDEQVMDIDGARRQ